MPKTFFVTKQLEFHHAKTLDRTRRLKVSRFFMLSCSRTQHLHRYSTADKGKTVSCYCSVLVEHVLLLL